MLNNAVRCGNSFKTTTRSISPSRIVIASSSTRKNNNSCRDFSDSIGSNVVPSTPAWSRRIASPASQHRADAITTNAIRRSGTPQPSPASVDSGTNNTEDDFFQYLLETGVPAPQIENFRGTSRDCTHDT
jgi:hypothetical protein